MVTVYLCIMTLFVADVGAYGWHIFKSSVSWLLWSHLSIFSTHKIAYTSF